MITIIAQRVVFLEFNKLSLFMKTKCQKITQIILKRQTQSSVVAFKYNPTLRLLPTLPWQSILDFNV